MYTVVYDVSSGHVPYWILGISFATTALGVLFLWTRYRFGSAIVLFFGALVAVAFAWRTQRLVHAKKVLRVGGAAVAVGTIHDYKPMPDTGHATERFCVRNTCFSYGHSELGLGFDHKLARMAGLRDGLDVKIYHAGNQILKLDVIDGK